MGSSTLSETVAYDIGLALPAPQKWTSMGIIIADLSPSSRDGRKARMRASAKRKAPTSIPQKKSAGKDPRDSRWRNNHSALVNIVHSISCPGDVRCQNLKELGALTAVFPIGDSPSLVSRVGGTPATAAPT